MTDTQELREKVARIVDPKGWSIWDRQSQEIDRIGLTGEDRNSAILSARTYASISLTRADAILALPELALQRQEAGAVAWRCFHCDETFTDRRCAAAHFGADEGAEPACQIKGSEGGLVEALRRAEKDAGDAWFAVHNEATDAAKAYYAQNSRHHDQMRALEQAGYDRGLADAKAHPEALGLYASPPPAEPASQGEAERLREARKFSLGERVTKIKGSSWTGYVVGFYSTVLTPIGYAVESETERGSVQIYPEAALAAAGGR